MARGISAHLTLAIQAGSGMTMREFADQVMGLKYGTFMYRIRNGCLRLEDYFKILGALPGYTFETLFWKQLPVAISSPLYPGPEQFPRVVNKVAIESFIKLPEQPEQKKEAISAPFVLPDLPLTMPD